MLAYFKELLSDGPSSLGIVLLGLYVGLLIAFSCVLFHRRTLGDFVRKLISSGALDPANAKTLAELGYEKSFAVKRALRGKSVFADTVFEASESPEFDREDHALPIYRESYDAGSARFYIPQVLKYRAEIRFENKGSHVMALVVGAILFGALILTVLLFKGPIIKAVNDWFSLMGS